MGGGGGRDKRKIGGEGRTRDPVGITQRRCEGRGGADPRRDGSLRTIRYWKVFRIRGNHEGCYQVVGVT